MLKQPASPKIFSVVKHILTMKFSVTKQNNYATSIYNTKIKRQTDISLHVAVSTVVHTE